MRAHHARLSRDGAKSFGLGEDGVGAERVKSEKIDALANLVDGVHERLASLLHDELGHGLGSRLDEIRRATKHVRARARRRAGRGFALRLVRGVKRA